MFRGLPGILCFLPYFYGIQRGLRKLKERLDFAQRQGGEPQAVRGVRQGEANAVFWQRKTLWLDVAKDKVVSRRQTMQYGKAKPTRQRRILVKENAIPLRRCPEYAGWRAGVFPH